VAMWTQFLAPWQSQLSAMGPLLCALVVCGIYGAPFYLVSWWSLVCCGPVTL